MANPIDRGEYGIVFYASTALTPPTYVDVCGQTQTAVALTGSMQRMPGSVDTAYFHVGSVARYTLQVDVESDDTPIDLGLLGHFESDPSAPFGELATFRNDDQATKSVHTFDTSGRYILQVTATGARLIDCNTQQLAAQSTTNRQGREQPLSPEQAAAVLELLRTDAQRCYDHYEELLNEDDQGQRRRPEDPQLARELARMNLTLNFYTQWYWKVDLHNLLHFLALRSDSHAQYEIRVYAEVIGQLVERWVPAAWGAFRDYRLEAASLSRQELQCVKQLLRDGTLDLKIMGEMTQREQREFREKLGLAVPSKGPSQ